MRSISRGKLLWKQDVGPLDQGAFDVPEYKWGSASSPIIYKDLVIVQCDQQKGSFLAAFDASTGKPVWRTQREALPSWSTPTVYEGGERAELVANGAEYFRGYDPRTGAELWRIKGTSMISVPTPFAAHGLDLSGERVLSFYSTDRGSQARRYGRCAAWSVWLGARKKAHRIYLRRLSTATTSIPSTTAES